MRVLLATSFPVPGEYDGTAMLPIKILRALKSRGIDVVLAHLRARPPWASSCRAEFEGTPLFTLPPREWISGLKRIRDEFPFDIVHAQHHGGAIRSYPACRIHGWPLVYELHSLLGEEVERDRLGRGPAFRFNLAMERRVARGADAVIVLGEKVKEVMVAEKGVDPARVRVIYPGIDLDEYHDSIRPATIDGIENHHKVAMYVGNIEHPNQGVPILIDALPRLFETIPEARCVLVGGPIEAGRRYKERLGRFADRLIVLTGKNPAEVVALTKRADVLVHSRLACRENYSVQSKIAVYLAAERPIVATDFADYQTVLGATRSGWLTAVDSGAIADGIVRVLTDPALAGTLAGNARAVAEEHFGMKRNIDRYLEVYRGAIDSSPLSGGFRRRFKTSKRPNRAATS